MVIWIAGLSGAGKTTVARLLYEGLKPSVPQLVLLDGDAIRETVSGDLGYAEGERVKQVTRVQRLARLLSQQGLVVIVALVYAHPDLLRWNREQIEGYFEVLLDAPIELVRHRDPKGIYRRASSGQMLDVVGHDIPWHRPVAPDLVLDPVQTPEALADRIAHAIPFITEHWMVRTARD
ncbi:MAG: adenylyl-sulfate kinase [Acidobacteria bacterium]|nr:adenylyl-sulfate kinase [Acidobacteriota bacterium]